MNFYKKYLRVAFALAIICAVISIISCAGGEGADTSSNSPANEPAETSAPADASDDTAESSPDVSADADTSAAAIINDDGSVTISSLDDWSALGEDADGLDRDYIAQILGGELDELDGVRFGEYIITREAPDEYGYRGIRLDIDVLESDVKTLPVGMNSLYIHGDGLFAPYVERAGDAVGDPTAAQMQIIKYLGLSGDYYLNAEGMTYYITRIKPLDKDGNQQYYSLDELRSYAKRCFDVEDFEPEGQALYKDENGYVLLGRGGNVWVYDFVSETRENGVIKVTMRFYSDLSRFVESDLVEYTFGDVADPECGYPFLGVYVYESGETPPFLGAV